MTFSYVGLIKKNTQISKFLVVSSGGRYYVWSADHARVESLMAQSALGNPQQLPLNELELATPRDIDIGRGALWKPNSSKVMIQVAYFGVVSGGQHSKRILVKKVPVFQSEWFTLTVDKDILVGVKSGDVIQVDSRDLSLARFDHIEAGLGRGTLKRRKKREVC